MSWKLKLSAAHGETLSKDLFTTNFDWCCCLQKDPENISWKPEGVYLTFTDPGNHVLFPGMLLLCNGQNSLLSLTSLFFALGLLSWIHVVVQTVGIYTSANDPRVPLINTNLVNKASIMIHPILKWKFTSYLIYYLSTLINCHWLHWLIHHWL